MNLTAWVNQFISFTSTDGFVLDVLTGAVLLVAFSACLGFSISVISAVFSRSR